MSLTREITVADMQVKVRELEVGQIREWLLDVESQRAADLVDVTLFEDFSVREVARFSNLSPSAIETLTPSQLRTVMEAAREINSDFFAMRERVAEIGRRLAQLPSSPAAES